ncbi:MAG: cell division protein CrgA, partial [Actinomycetota bacterium]
DRTAGRYTAPTVRPEDMPSAAWVPIVMAVLFGLGMLTIIVNYLEWWPGSPSNNYLGVGLLFVLAGTVLATRWR